MYFSVLRGYIPVQPLLTFAVYLSILLSQTAAVQFMMTGIAGETGYVVTLKRKRYRCKNNGNR